MKYMRRLLSAKIHRARVTQADLDYEGSITLPPHLMEAANMVNFELVHVWNVTRGTRLETYAIVGQESSSDICVNGAAAHLMQVDDLVIIASFIDVYDQDVAKHTPSVVFVDENNQIKQLAKEVPGPKLVKR